LRLSAWVGVLRDEMAEAEAGDWMWTARMVDVDNGAVVEGCGEQPGQACARSCSFYRLMPKSQNYISM
jgi:hypothetical protein